MCGVFTAFASWSEVVDFSQPLTAKNGDELIRLRVGQPIPVIVYDSALGERVVLQMQWGFPTKNGRGLAHFHVRSETIDEKVFAPLFRDGKRGIVAVRTFNEGPSDEKGRTIQHTIDPHEEAPLGFAVLFDKFTSPTAGDLMACVQVTVPANALIATLGGDVDRMPAFIDHADWGAWLGQTKATPDELKALLKTKEGVRWTMSKEQKAAQAKKAKTKPTVSDPTPGLF